MTLHSLNVTDLEVYHMAFLVEKAETLERVEAHLKHMSTQKAFFIADVGRQKGKVTNQF